MMGPQARLLTTRTGFDTVIISGAMPRPCPPSRSPRTRRFYNTPVTSVSNADVTEPCLIQEATMAMLHTLLEGTNFGTDRGIVGFCGVFLITSDSTTILFDTGHVGRRTALESALDATGVATSEIDYVFLSHAHWDHVQNIDIFENAEFLLSPTELRYSRKPHRNDWSTPKWTGTILETVPTREVLDGDIVAPGVEVMEVPGHSPGSLALSVETDQGIACLAGDALHFAYVAQTKKNPTVFWDDALATESIERLVQRADVLYPGHDRPFRLVEGAVEYLTPLDLTIHGVSDDGVSVRPGVSLAPAEQAVQWIMPGIEDQDRLFGGELGRHGM